MRREPKPIICKHCGKSTGYTEEELSMLVIPREGLHCRQCKEIFLQPKRLEWAAD